ncbi:MAG: 3-dehydroquinate synthase [Patescibacteria group bacterium]|nr:3-dehydroquinate synthase [Patescibacteria group bacterium]
MVEIIVNLENNSYPIKIGKGIVAEENFKKFGCGKFAIITDSNVGKLYAVDLGKKLNQAGLFSKVFSFTAGEKSKTFATVISLGRKMIKNGFGRESMIIALGGGVVGDLAGFLASIFERGIKFIQIPTTLLAQVDSSIGGKTGVDMPEGKNLFGAFYQPVAVITAINFLNTLPKKEIKNGLAELIKYGTIKDAKLYEFLQNNYSNLGEKELVEIIERAAKIKAAIVSKDEKESGERTILNYGHTIGHAIETIENYKISHGEAVALGMVFEGKISNLLGLLSDADLSSQNELIHSAGLPTVYKGNINKLVEIMEYDKKAQSGSPRFVLPIKIGTVKQKEGQFAFAVEENIIRKSLK